MHDLFVHVAKNLHHYLHSWVVVVLVLITLLRLLLLPIGFWRYRVRTKFRQLEKHWIDLNRRYKDQPRVYEAVYMRLYSQNKISPASLLSLTGAYAILTLLGYSFIVSLSHEMRSEKILGTSLTSSAGHSQLGALLIALETGLGLVFLYQSTRGRGIGYQAALACIFLIPSMFVALHIPVIAMCCVVFLLLWSVLEFNFLYPLFSRRWPIMSTPLSEQEITELERAAKDAE